MDLTGAERASGLGERRRRRHHEARAGEDGAGEPRNALRELEVGAPDLHDDRPAEAERQRARRQPVGVDEIRVGRGLARGAPERAEHQRQRERALRPAPEVLDDAVAVGDPVVGEPGWGDDVDGDSALPNSLDRVGDEAARGVAGEARVRRRQDRDLHGSTRFRNTMGTAAAMTAKA